MAQRGYRIYPKSPVSEKPGTRSQIHSHSQEGGRGADCHAPCCGAEASGAVRCRTAGSRSHLTGVEMWVETYLPPSGYALTTDISRDHCESPDLRKPPRWAARLPWAAEAMAREVPSPVRDSASLCPTGFGAPVLPQWNNKHYSWGREGTGVLSSVKFTNTKVYWVENGLLKRSEFMKVWIFFQIIWPFVLFCFNKYDSPMKT